MKWGYLLFLLLLLPHASAQAVELGVEIGEVLTFHLNAAETISESVNGSYEINGLNLGIVVGISEAGEPLFDEYLNVLPGEDFSMKIVGQNQTDYSLNVEFRSRLGKVPGVQPVDGLGFLLTTLDWDAHRTELETIEENLADVPAAMIQIIDNSSNFGYAFFQSAQYLGDGYKYIITQDYKIVYDRVTGVAEEFYVLSEIDLQDEIDDAIYYYELMDMDLKGIEFEVVSSTTTSAFKIPGFGLWLILSVIVLLSYRRRGF